MKKKLEELNAAATARRQLYENEKEEKVSA
jgi:hypothetical protein